MGIIPKIWKVRFQKINGASLNEDFGLKTHQNAKVYLFFSNTSDTFIKVRLLYNRLALIACYLLDSGLAFFCFGK